ncbi:MAG TPA: hypothetical protein VE010_04040 [Thermoanaerobaculia bacterium]|nr:hypothetical protein [Thermoanaerobaculia bacterium]
MKATRDGFHVIRHWIKAMRHGFHVIRDRTKAMRHGFHVIRDRKKAMRDGFHRLPDRLKATGDTSRSPGPHPIQATGAVFGQARSTRRVAAADQRDAAMLDHDLHAGADREPMLFEPPSRHSQVRHDGLGEGAPRNPSRGEREDVRRSRRPRLRFSTRSGRPCARFPYAARSRPAERGQTADGIGQS